MNYELQFWSHYVDVNFWEISSEEFLPVMAVVAINKTIHTMLFAQSAQKLPTQYQLSLCLFSTVIYLVNE